MCDWPASSERHIRADGVGGGGGVSGCYMKVAVPLSSESSSLDLMSIHVYTV